MIKIFYTSNYKQLNKDVFDNYLKELPINMQYKISRYLKWEDAQASLFGKLLLKKVLANFCKSHTINDLKITQWGRPNISQSFDFNISHSGQYVVCAFSDEGKVGIDLEKIQEVDLSYFGDVLTPLEIENINCSNDKYSLFYSYWTLKEAIVKADGRGLSISPSEIKISPFKATLEGTDWYFQNTNFKPGYILHLVSNKKIIQQLEVIEVFFERMDIILPC